MLNTNRISSQKHLFLPWTELRQTTYILALYFAPIFALKVFYKYEKYIENVKKPIVSHFHIDNLIKNKINPLETQVSTLESFKIFRVLGKNGDFASQRKKVH